MNDFSDKDQLEPGDSSHQPSESAGFGAGEKKQEPLRTGEQPPVAPGHNPSGAGNSGAAGSWTSGQRQEPAQNQGYRYGSGPYQTPPPTYGQGYGQQGTPYTPPYSSGSYPPGQNTTGGYNNTGYTGQPGAYNNQRYNSTGTPPYHQYNSNSGWQQHSRPEDKYEWKFEDYDKLDPKKGKKKRSRGLVVFTVSLLCVLSAGLVCLAGYSLYSVSSDQYKDGEEEASSLADGAAPSSGELELSAKPEIVESLPAGGKMTIPQVAKAVSPSVVGVIKYDNNQYFQMGGLGSGIIMTEDGYIITNAHVVAEGTGFKIELSDGNPYDAVLVGADAMTDLAVLKIEATGLTPAQFGDSSQIEVGETVLAIGNPAGQTLAGSVTQGIVSAVNREVFTTNNMTYIQTDAAINPGNSGGALVNEYGQVIGINSNKIVAEGFEGIGFAIPISEAKPIIDELITNGRVTGRTMLGITASAVDEVDARNYNIQMGLVINTISSQELVNKGVQKGDILTHIDEVRIYTQADVRKALDAHKPGDTVSLTFYRRIGTKEMTYDITTKLLESE